MVNVPFQAETGITGMISWLTASTDGWFFIFFLIVLFFIIYIPLTRIWGSDKSLLASSFGIFIISIPIYYLHGLSERAIFVIITIFILSVIKFLTYKA